MLNKAIFNDVLGTYLQYDLVLKYPLYNQGKYASLYEMLNDPVDGHTFVLPYNNESVEITAFVESLSDKWKELDSGRTYWEAFRVVITANGPTKTYTLAQAIRRGMKPLPDVYNAELGDTYTFTNNGWESAGSFGDADNTLY